MLKSMLADRHFAFDVDLGLRPPCQRLAEPGGYRAPKGSTSTTPTRRWPGSARSTRPAAAPPRPFEEALYRHRQPLFGAVSIAFFDKRLRERFGIAQACIVADRGMIFRVAVLAEALAAGALEP